MTYYLYAGWWANTRKRFLNVVTVDYSDIPAVMG
jgi:hypothetical protein